MQEIHRLPMVPALIEPTVAINKGNKDKARGPMESHYSNLGVKKSSLEEVIEKFLSGLSIRKIWVSMGLQLGSN